MTSGFDVAKNRHLDRRRLLVGGTAALLAGAAAAPLRADEPRRLLHVDSYHRGNEWNDRIAAAVEKALQGSGITVRIEHMDTKRRDSEADKQAAARRIVEIIDSYQPHIVTTSDDNAVKYLLMPYYRDADLPFVFCGVNWDASGYGLPYANATGMVEVSPIPQIVEWLERHANGPRLGFLAEDTPTKHKEMNYHERLFGIGYHTTYFVSDFPGWLDAFRAAQTEVDMLMLLGVGRLTDWDADLARRVAEDETRIPTGTDFAWLMPYSLFGIGKLPEEQGEWVAGAARKILDGVSPRDIPVTHNVRGELLFNPRIAATIGIKRRPPLARVIE